MSRLAIILYEPEIPPNTGNIIRLCANSGAALHLIEPLGFKLEDKQLKRAGLDYKEWASIKLWANLDNCLEEIKPKTLYLMTTKGSRNFFTVTFQTRDVLLFGPETRGLPPEVLTKGDEKTRLKLPAAHSNQGGRSLNLANSVAISMYEVWRQLGFDQSL